MKNSIMHTFVMVEVSEKEWLFSILPILGVYDECMAKQKKNK